MFTMLIAAALTAQSGQSPTLNVPGTPDNAPTTVIGCLMPAGGTTSTPGSGGSSGTGPAGMNADAANTGVFFVVNLGKKKQKPAETSYTLVGVDQAELQRNLNRRVQVSGSVEKQAGPPAPGAGGVAVTTGKEAGAKSPSRFRVTALKQVPGGCGGQ